MDDLGLIETVGRLGEGVVVIVTDAADGGLDARLRQALGVPVGTDTDPPHRTKLRRPEQSTNL